MAEYGAGNREFHERVFRALPAVERHVLLVEAYLVVFRRIDTPEAQRDVAHADSVAVDCIHGIDIGDEHLTLRDRAETDRRNQQRNGATEDGTDQSDIDRANGALDSLAGRQSNEAADAHCSGHKQEYIKRGRDEFADGWPVAGEGGGDKIGMPGEGRKDAGAAGPADVLECGGSQQQCAHHKDQQAPAPQPLQCAEQEETKRGEKQDRRKQDHAGVSQP